MEELKVSIEYRDGVFIVSVNGVSMGTWTYLDGAVEAVRKELMARIYRRFD